MLITSGDNSRKHPALPIFHGPLRSVVLVKYIDTTRPVERVGPVNVATEPLGNKNAIIVKGIYLENVNGIRM